MQKQLNDLRAENANLRQAVAGKESSSHPRVAPHSEDHFSPWNGIQRPSPEEEISMDIDSDSEDLEVQSERDTSFDTSERPTRASRQASQTAEAYVSEVARRATENLTDEELKLLSVCSVD